MPNVSTTYISASANRHNHAADSSESSLIAFGSSKLVALWESADEDGAGVSQTLPGHEGLVTCISFVRDNILVSADDKGVMKCWLKSHSQWDAVESIQAHSKAVSAVSQFEDLVVTGASDSSIKIWGVVVTDYSELQVQLKEVQAISLNGKYPLSFSLAYLPLSKVIVLAIASTDNKFQVWTQSEDLFVRSAVLSGHEDWVRSLAFGKSSSDAGLLTLASGSQDGTIRLWNFEIFSKSSAVSTNTPPPDVATSLLTDELLDAFEASLGDLEDGEEGGRQISLKRHMLTVKTNEGGSQQFSITFDALLVGHEAGVTSLSWRPPSPSTSSLSTLLSTSTDSSLILWSPSSIMVSSNPADASSSIWINRQRFGDVGGQRLGGFLGGLWAKEGREALAWGWAGGWRRWRCVGHGDTEDWKEAGAIGGHNGPVKAIDWSPKGEFLISAGNDQTTRIHGSAPTSSELTQIWHELGRPQVHGYDLVGVTFLDTMRFVSIADEKVARVFEAPRGFVHIIKGLGVAQVDLNESERPLGASVPPLGLSNKALSERTPGYNEDVTAIRRPYEGELASATLWPEIEKVFGHGYESISLSVSNSRRLVATACKATTAEHAVIRIYSTSSWQLVGRPLEGHSLTVTRIAFSPDDQFVLSVSRDRTWRLFKRGKDGGYTPVAADKSHARIIWDCTWSFEGDIFVTASRDKTVRIWSIKDEDSGKKWTPIVIIKMKEAATAVSLSSPDSDGLRRLAVGLETGEILVLSNSETDLSVWKQEIALDSRMAHVDHVYRLAWRPGREGLDKELATCSEDGILKILTVQVRSRVEAIQGNDA